VVIPEEVVVLKKKYKAMDIKENICEEFLIVVNCPIWQAFALGSDCLAVVCDIQVSTCA